MCNYYIIIINVINNTVTFGKSNSIYIKSDIIYYIDIDR